MRRYFKALILILFCLVVLVPFASSDPDGLEKVSETLGIEETPSVGLVPDYKVPTIQNSYFSTITAGILGVFLVLGAAFVLGMTITKSSK